MPAHLPAHKLEFATLILVARVVFQVQLQSGLVHTRHFALLLIGHVEAGALVHIMVHKLERVVKQKAAKVVSHRQLQVSHAYIHHHVIPIHGLVVHGVRVRLRVFKIVTVIKPLIVYLLKLPHHQSLNIAHLQILKNIKYLQQTSRLQIRIILLRPL